MTQNVGYQPSVASAQKALGPNAKIDHRPHPPGGKGAAVSLDETCKRIKVGKDDPYLRGWAGKVLIAAGKPKDATAQVQAILDAFRKQTMFRPDPIGTEMIVAPKYTLCLVEGGLCIPIRDCDDGTVVMASACLASAIPVQVVGQCFDDSGVPTHVLLAVKGAYGWDRVEPSHDSWPVGKYHPATKEWWLDPLEDKTVTLDGATPSGTFVGVGWLPVREEVGVGALTPLEKGAMYDAVTSQLQTAIFTLEKSVNELGAALQQVQQSRTLLRQPLDPEPFQIGSLADFPTNGIWTAGMNEIAIQIWTVGDTLVRAGHDALNGVRKVMVDEPSKETYIEAAPSDPWSLHTVVDAVADRIYGFFDSAQKLLSGVSARDGRVLTPAQIQQIASPVPNGTIQGLAEASVGVGNLAIVIGVVAGVAIVSVSACYAVSKWSETAKVAAKEATNKTIIEAVASGQLTATQGHELLATVTQNRVLEAEAEKKNELSNPFTDLKNLGTVAMWVMIGGVTIYGLSLAAPLVREVVASASTAHRARRLAR